MICKWTLVVSSNSFMFLLIGEYLSTMSLSLFCFDEQAGMKYKSVAFRSSYILFYDARELQSIKYEIITD